MLTCHQRYKMRVHSLSVQISYVQTVAVPSIVHLPLHTRHDCAYSSGKHYVNSLGPGSLVGNRAKIIKEHGPRLYLKRCMCVFVGSSCADEKTTLNAVYNTIIFLLAIIILILTVALWRMRRRPGKLELNYSWN